MIDIKNTKEFAEHLADLYEEECDAVEYNYFKREHFVEFLTKHLHNKDKAIQEESVEEEFLDIEDTYVVQCAFFRNGCCQNNGSCISTECKGNKLKCIYPGFKRAAQRWATFGKKK